MRRGNGFWWILLLSAACFAGYRFRSEITAVVLNALFPGAGKSAEDAFHVMMVHFRMGEPIREVFSQFCSTMLQIQ